MTYEEIGHLHGHLAETKTGRLSVTCHYDGVYARGTEEHADDGVTYVGSRIDGDRAYFDFVDPGDEIKHAPRLPEGCTFTNAADGKTVRFSAFNIYAFGTYTNGGNYIVVEAIIDRKTTA